MNIVSKKLNYQLLNSLKNKNSPLGTVINVKEPSVNVKIMVWCVNVQKKMNGEYVILALIKEKQGLN